jgi:hypothetical protein
MAPKFPASWPKGVNIRTDLSAWRVPLKGSWRLYRAVERTAIAVVIVELEVVMGRYLRGFFQHHFFAREDQMDYPVKAQRDHTLLQMLRDNGMAVTDARRVGVRRQRLMQSLAQAIS